MTHQPSEHQRRRQCQPQRTVEPPLSVQQSHQSMRGLPLATAIVSTVMVVASGWIFLVGLANAIIGWGLWKQQEWGRIGALVLAVFRLFSFPVGTVIGALIFWYLLREDVKQEFHPGGRAQARRDPVAIGDGRTGPETPAPAEPA